jgi:hypothetical protein
MLPNSLAIPHGKAMADPSTGYGLERLVSAKALRSAAKSNIALTGILSDGVAVDQGVTCQGTLPHLLQPVGAMAGFSLPSRVDCNSKTAPEGGAS